MGVERPLDPPRGSLVLGIKQRIGIEVGAKPRGRRSATPGASRRFSSSRRSR